MQKNRHSSPSDSPERKNNLAQVSSPSPRPLLSCIYRSCLVQNLRLLFFFADVGSYERLSEEHNHRSDPATSTSLVLVQLANYHILKHACNLPTNNRPVTKVIIRPPPSILSWIFFFFLFYLFLFLFSFPFLSLTSHLFSPRNCPKPTLDALKSKVSRSLIPCACWNSRPSGMISCSLSLSLSFVIIPPIFLFSSFPLIRPAHTNLQIRLSDQVTLAVAANN